MRSLKCKGPCERVLLWPQDFPKAGFDRQGRQKWRLDLCYKCWRFSNKRRAILRKSLEVKV